jgi:hypothetical protein
MLGVSPGGREREVPHELVAMCHLKRSLPSLGKPVVAGS